MTLSQKCVLAQEFDLVHPGAYEPLRKKERQTSVLILYQSHFKNAPYMDFNLLMLTSFEVTTTDSQEPPAVTIATWLAS